MRPCRRKRDAAMRERRERCGHAGDARSVCGWVGGKGDKVYVAG
jgi:hypothetical protein